MSSHDDPSNKNQDIVTKKAPEEGGVKIEEKIAQTLLPQIIEQATTTLLETIKPELDLALKACQNLQQSSQNLEARVVALEEKIDQASPRKLIELSEISFKTVLDADYHLDDKANRILSAMAFLTAAAAAIFAKAYSLSLPPDYDQKIRTALLPYIPQDNLDTVSSNLFASLKPVSIQIFHLDLSLISFFAYLLFVLIGATLYLIALGPSLNKPKDWLPSGWFPTSPAELKSLLFYDHIGTFEEKAWKSQWEKEPVALQTQIENNYIRESRLIAEKARAKFRWMSLGSISFRLAIICLIPLVASLFSSEARFVWSLSIFGIALLIVVFIFARMTRPSQNTELLYLRFLWLIALITLSFLYLVFVIANIKLSIFGSLAFFFGVCLCGFTSFRLFYNASQLKKDKSAKSTALYNEPDQTKKDELTKQIELVEKARSSSKKHGIIFVLLAVMCLGVMLFLIIHNQLWAFEF